MKIKYLLKINFFYTSTANFSLKELDFFEKKRKKKTLEPIAFFEMTMHNRSCIWP